MENNSLGSQDPQDKLNQVRAQINKDVLSYFSLWGQPPSLEILSRPLTRTLVKYYPQGLASLLDLMAEAGEVLVAITPKGKKVIFPLIPRVEEMVSLGTLLDALVEYDQASLTRRTRPSKQKDYADDSSL